MTAATQRWWRVDVSGAFGGFNENDFQGPHYDELPEVIEAACFHSRKRGICARVFEFRGCESRKHFAGYARGGKWFPKEKPRRRTAGDSK